MNNAEFIPQIARKRFGSCTLGVDMLSCNNCSTNYMVVTFNLLCTYLQQVAVCWFPSEHFYGTMLRPHKSVARATAPGLENFWPNGMFVHVQ